MKRLIVFDLDGTLAASKSAIDSEMAALLGSLLAVVEVGIISGGAWSQFQAQILDHLPSAAALQRLSLLPTCGTKFYRYDGQWVLLYSEDFTPDEAGRITRALQETAAAAHVEAAVTWGDVIENRGSQITFSGLGQKAPLAEKARWDPDFAKRQRMKSDLDHLLPDFSVRLGGATSIDVTKLGIDKAYGIRKLRDVRQIAISDMLFVGDALFPGGNDYPARGAGAPSIQVRDPEESKCVMEAIIACLGGPPENAPPT